MFEIHNIKKELRKIWQRNKRVEADKAWETSFFRRSLVTVVIYFIAVLFLYLINDKNYWLNALIPAGAFVLSTLTLPFIKKWWIKNRYKN